MRLGRGPWLSADGAPIKMPWQFYDTLGWRKRKGKGLWGEKNPGFWVSRESCKLPWHFPTRKSQQRPLKKTSAQDRGSRKLGMKLPGLWTSVCERACLTWARGGEERGGKAESRTAAPPTPAPRLVAEGSFCTRGVPGKAFGKACSKAEKITCWFLGRSWTPQSSSLVSFFDL